MHTRTTANPSAATNWLGRLWLRKLTPWLCFAFVALFFLPMLNLGLSVDDYLHYDAITKAGMLPANERGWMFHLFTFFDGDVERNKILIERIALPWWTDNQIRINFFRPLSAITQWLDYQLWPQNIALKHFHSILWYGMLITAVYFLFSRIFKQQALALFATFIFTIDFSHFLNVSWIASRNALLAVFFGTLTLILYHHWRTHKSLLTAITAPLCFLCGLFSGEMAIATCAYLASYALFLDQGTFGKRILRITPFGVIFIVWWYNYQALGYGSNNSGFYLDLANYPLEFVQALLYRVPTLLFAQWSGLSTLLFLGKSPEQTKIIFAASLVFLLIIIWLLWPLIKSSAIARFWLLGSTLAVIPSASTFPHERVLLFADLGGAALIAQLLFSWNGKVTWRNSEALRSWFTALLFFMHLIFQPIAYIFAANAILAINSENIHRLSTELPYDKLTPEHHLFYINQPSAFFFPNLILARSYNHLETTQHNYMLGSRYGSMEVERVDENSLRITMPRGIIPEVRGGNLALIFRQWENGVKMGESFDRGDCTYTAEAVTGLAGFPKKFLFSCKKSLDNKQYLWLAYDKNKTIAWQAPKLGETVILNPSTPIQTQDNTDTNN